MPSRSIIAKRVAELFRLMSHPDRIRLIEELRGVELDVTTLSERLGLPGPRISQHLAQLRSHRLVEERRQGRHHFYSLQEPRLANWIIEILPLVDLQLSDLDPATVERAQQLWSNHSPQGLEEMTASPTSNDNKKVS